MTQFLPIFSFIALLTLYSSANSATLLVSAPDSNCVSTIEKYCTIQSAINNASIKDTILISAGHYFENISISKHITLIGNKNLTTIIDGTESGSVIHINPGSRVSIKNIHIMNGKAQNGGGIHNEGSLMLANSEVKQNIALHSGGGIYNARSISGSLFIEKCKIIHNKALGDDEYNVKYGGGGIYNNSLLNINMSSISNNYAEDNGGGIYSVFSGRATPSNSQLMAEEIGLAAAPKRKNTLNRKSDINAVTINRTSISNNISGSGGGINLQGVMNIKKSAIDSNKAINQKRSAGGGIFAHLDTTLHISNTTISRNEATFRGGGIRFYSTKIGSLNSVSIIYNNLTKKIGQGAGLFVENYTKQFNIQNSLVTENKIMGSITSECSGIINSDGYNFIASTENCNWNRNTGDILGDKNNLKAGIVWDKNQTRYFVTENSPLIDKGSPVGCTNEKGEILKKDQFNKSRLTNTNEKNKSQCDIGAVAF